MGCLCWLCWRGRGLCWLCWRMGCLCGICWRGRGERFSGVFLYDRKIKHFSTRTNPNRTALRRAAYIFPFGAAKRYRGIGGEHDPTGCRVYLAPHVKRQSHDFPIGQGLEGISVVVDQNIQLTVSIRKVFCNTFLPSGRKREGSPRRIVRQQRGVNIERKGNACNACTIGRKRYGNLNGLTGHSSNPPGNCQSRDIRFFNRYPYKAITGSPHDILPGGIAKCCRWTGRKTNVCGGGFRRGTDGKAQGEQCAIGQGRYRRLFVESDNINFPICVCRIVQHNGSPAGWKIEIECIGNVIVVAVGCIERQQGFIIVKRKSNTGNFGTICCKGNRHIYRRSRWCNNGIGNIKHWLILCGRSNEHRTIAGCTSSIFSLCAAKRSYRVGRESNARDNLSHRKASIEAHREQCPIGDGRQRRIGIENNNINLPVVVGRIIFCGGSPAG